MPHSSRTQVAQATQTPLPGLEPAPLLGHAPGAACAPPVTALHEALSPYLDVSHLRHLAATGDDLRAALQGGGIPFGGRFFYSRAEGAS
ncbi:hypothetical protein EYB53_025240 [Candidatus Chloroploca sp. M-50]|uniref:Uncharacterized protein n=1 Tax=Candidatus Chloroploca mongolica TaxID=2528176 RepID=A0ABS4DHY9_9CHLR|nr:hypothetical protein [Candidatus Chloroploca mongolica]MBP1469038.1 hypothetical protein [Candidatus Chloroploca mongolica]